MMRAHISTNSLMYQITLFDNRDQGDFRLGSGGSLVLSGQQPKPLHLQFDGGRMSSDGGWLMLGELDRRLGLSQALAEAVTDRRDRRYVRHRLEEMLRQRILQIAGGYADANDCNYLREDPVLKLAAGRLPASEGALASQPTMSRLENTPTRSELYRMAEALLEVFIRSYEKPPKLIVLDVDDTDSPVYGDQQLALFNRYYREHCYMPLHIYEGLSGRLVTSLLKPSRLKGAAMRGILRRLIGRLRALWPQTTILFRADSHFTYPEVMAWIDGQEGVHYLTGLSPNQALKGMAKGLLEKAKTRFEATGEDVLFYRTRRYKARSWSRQRKIVMKVEYSEEGPNLRLVVTDLEAARARVLYEQLYCGRWRAEHFIKDHKCYLRSDRASCHRFEANQLRLFLHSAAYVLWETLRRTVLHESRWATATIETLQLRLLKLACVVQELNTRVKVIFSATCPVESVLTGSLIRLLRGPPLQR